MQQPQKSKATTLADLLSYLRHDPDNARLRAAVFDAALAAGEFGEAGFQVAHARHLDPDDVPWRNRQGQLHLARGEFAEAEAIFAGLVGEGRDGPALRYNLAYAKFGRGAFSEAQGLAEPLRAERDGTGDLAWVLWLRCGHHLGSLEGAITAFSQVSASRPLPADAWGVASLLALDAGKMVEATAWSERALTEDPRQLEALVTRATLALGGPAPDSAVALFEHALQVSPTDGRSWSGLAFTLLRQGNFTAAREAFTKAVATMPSHIGTWIGLGWAEIFAGRPDAARLALEHAVSLDRNVADSHGTLAVALARLNRPEAAQLEIDVALRLDRTALAARYAQGILTGEADDPKTARRLFRRLLAGRSVGLGRHQGDTLEDLVLGPAQPSEDGTEGTA